MLHAGFLVELTITQKEKKEGAERVHYVYLFHSSDLFSNFFL